MEQYGDPRARQNALLLIMNNVQNLKKKNSLGVFLVKNSV